MVLDILTPEESLFSGEINSVTVPGINGRFQILNNHAPIVSALGQGQIDVEKTDGKIETFRIDRGFIEVLKNEVSLLVHVPVEEKPDGA